MGLRKWWQVITGGTAFWSSAPSWIHSSTEGITERSAVQLLQSGRGYRSIIDVTDADGNHLDSVYSPCALTPEEFCRFALKHMAIDHAMPQDTVFVLYQIGSEEQNEGALQVRFATRNNGDWPGYPSAAMIVYREKLDASVSCHDEMVVGYYKQGSGFVVEYLPQWPSAVDQ